MSRNSGKSTVRVQSCQRASKGVTHYKTKREAVQAYGPKVKQCGYCAGWAPK